MSRMPSSNEVARIRAAYPAGTRLELIRMDDPYTALQPGDKGTVQYIDDIGQIHMQWDRGSSLALIPGEDQYRKVEER